MSAPVRAVSGTVTFGPAIGIPVWGWASLGEPFRWAGLGAMTVTGFLTWPLLVLTLLFFIPELIRGGLVPRRWRIAYRQRHGRDGARSAYISKRLRRVVLSADRHRCVACKTRAMRLEVDHVRPWAAGGLTTLFNCMTLCQRCNGIKLNYWRDADGYEHYARQYAAGSRSESIPYAREILHRERMARLSLLRWTRAAWALAV